MPEFDFSRHIYYNKKTNFYFLEKNMIYELEHLGCSDYFKKIHCENLCFPPHIHNCFELIVCLSGTSSITIDEKNYKLNKGECVLVFPHQVHSFEKCQSRQLICIFSPNTVSAYFCPINSLKPTCNKFTPDSELISKLEKYNSDNQRLYEKGVLYLICNEFDKTTQYQQNTNRSLLVKIFLFINQNFKSDCSLNTISKHIGYNASYVSRYFKTCVGISLCDYINMVRLGNVCMLYENSNDTLLNHAYNSGFDSLRTFNRNFKKFYNASPKEYFKVKNNKNSAR